MDEKINKRIYECMHMHREGGESKRSYATGNLRLVYYRVSRALFPCIRVI